MLRFKLKSIHSYNQRYISTQPLITPSIPNHPNKAITEITTLPNGLRVASINAPSHFVSVGAFIGTGTRNETDKTAGLSHLMDRLAFKTTKEYTNQQVVQTIEHIGGNVLSHSTRENIMYQAAVFPKDIEKTVSLFSSIITNPLFLNQDINEVKQSTLFEIDDLKLKPDTYIPEILHATAFNNSGFGRPLFCSEDKLSSVTSDQLVEYHRLWYTANRIVVAGVGMSHQALLEAVAGKFDGIPKGSDEILGLQQKSIDNQPVRYVGGVKLIDTDSLPPSPNPEDIPLTRIHIAFESLSMNDPDIYALATLASLMGGGGSFSAGGPGKGMYTRLYTDVLNRHHWVENCNMINHSYGETGLFGISASIPPHKKTHAAIIPILCEQFFLMTQVIKPDELSRAKNQLKSSLLMGLESKMVELEDLGRQLLLNNKRLGVDEMCARIEMLTADDLKRVARRVIFNEDSESPLNFFDPVNKPWKRTGKGNPTVVIHGPLSARDPLRDVEKTLGDWKIGKVVKSGKKFWPF